MVAVRRRDAIGANEHVRLGKAVQIEAARGMTDASWFELGATSPTLHLTASPGIRSTNLPCIAVVCRSTVRRQALACTPTIAPAAAPTVIQRRVVRTGARLAGSAVAVDDTPGSTASADRIS